MKKQNVFFGTVGLLAIFISSGCTRTNLFTTSHLQPNIASIVQPQASAAPVRPKIQTLEIPQFIDPVALRQLSETDKNTATNAQFYALQFGRPGAPRTWTGQNNVSGSIVVGPYVTLNGQTCRVFTHTIIIEGTPRIHEGTSCRLGDGNWVVRRS